MRAETAAALKRINRHFYSRHAAEFSARREAPWPGWRRVAEGVERRRQDRAGVISVLDLGCGNGRLARFLDARWPDGFEYLGVDESAALLEIAAASIGAGGRRLLLQDLMRPLPTRLPGEPFDLIAVFGLMHHLPGTGNRRALLRRAARRLAPGGLLAVSFWQFGERQRFRRRSVPWEEHNRHAAEPIDLADLEPGDRLLRWGEESGGPGAAAVRYCHWTPPAEVDQLLTGLPLAVADGFSADGASGDLNLYRTLNLVPGTGAESTAGL